jgi:type IV pilus assembly protein PilE
MSVCTQLIRPLRGLQARVRRANKARELHPSTSCNRGFTLVDLMIAVAIIAFLSAIAFPSYQEALRKVRRAEARAALLQLMQEQERYYSQKGLYIPFTFGTTNAEAQKFKTYSGVSASSSAYEISGTTCAGETSTRSCLTLVATPGTTNVNSNYSDPVCGKLTLSTNGTKATDPVITSGICW